MDIYDRLSNIEQRLAALEGLVHGERPRNRDPRKTDYLPQVTDEMVELSKLDKRIDQVRKKDSEPNLRAAVSAVSRAVSVAKEAQLLVEDVQQLAKTLMEDSEN